MSLFDVLSKGFCSKKRESNEILSQEEYKDKFLHGDEYIKRELYDEYISRRLSEEFGLKYNEKIKKWHSEWSANRRFVVELCYPRGNHIYLRWGYNYDFIPDINSKNKLTWHRTESSVKIHIADMCHIRAFLYAKNNDIDNATELISALISMHKLHF